MPSSPSGQTGDKDGVPAGAIVGIVIALIVLVIVCVVVILLIRRRVEGQKGLASLTCKKFRKLHKKSKEGVPSVTISASTGGDDIIPVGNDVNTSCVSRGTVTNGRPQHGTSPYEIEDIQESSNYYSVPVNKYGAPAVRPTYKTKTQSSDYDLAAIVESGGDYSTVDDADLEERRAKARPDEYAKVKKPKGGNYNKLSFQNPGFDG
ncbi:hypothetical protein BaRGS_00018667 [Batillaria attramentaria]|uniref:Uncharacterized protein n=1 Tax=Batillaria attramentaria TaxID=370345 RepID=A0ABD0KSL4_9CAEN